MSESSSYKNIFKTTFLFGFVQVFNILVKVILNKIAAVFLGTEGIGIIGLFNNAIVMIKNGAGLGVSQSAIKDISEANAVNDKNKFSESISLVNKTIRSTALLGVAITIVLSPWLSKWTFGNNHYIVAFIVLSLAVGMGILSEGQLTILKGMRQLHVLAKASLWGAIAGLISAIPFYYYLKERGIVPVIIITALAVLYFSNRYVRKIKYNRVKFSTKDFVVKSTPMIKMGIALMIVGFLGSMVDLIITAYINNHSGTDIVGLYQAGVTIVSGYFGIVLTAMATDYYPRISAVNKDNAQLQIELNRQSEVGLLILYPLIIIFVFFAPLMIKILYTDQFLNTTLYTDYAILGMLIILYSNNAGMIMLAKQDAKVFLWFTILANILVLVSFLILFRAYGLLGLGIAYFIKALFLNMIPTVLIVKYRYNINFDKRLYLQLGMVLLTAIIALFVKQLNSDILKYSVGCVLLVFSLVYCYQNLKNRMSIDLLKIITKKNLKS